MYIAHIYSSKTLTVKDLVQVNILTRTALEQKT